MLRRLNVSANRKLTVGFSKVKGSPNWVVYLPESGAEFQYGSREEIAHHISPDLAGHFNYLVINKTGLTPKGDSKAAFERSFRRDLRVRDALKAMKAIIPRDGKIYLVGYSEGAYLAPEIARGDSRVKSVAMIGGGTRGWLKEELSQVRGSAREKVEQQIRRIYREKTSAEKWNGFSFATWYSYREDRTLKALKGLNKPVLALLGAHDRVIDFKSALSDLLALKKKQNVKIEVLPNCGHEFHGHWGTVRKALEEFIR